jgi:beta-lactamase class D
MWARTSSSSFGLDAPPEAWSTIVLGCTTTFDVTLNLGVALPGKILDTNISGGIDKFWLEGQLRISAVNQVEFLESLYLNKLSASKENQLIVKEALVTEAAPEYLVHSKTGFSGVGTESNPGVAWWVGWVEKETEVYFFAFNMDIDNESKLPLRKSIPTKIMESEGIIGG